MPLVPYSDDIGSQRMRNTSLIVRMDNLDLGICPIFPNGMGLGTQSVIRARQPEDGSFPFEHCCIPSPRRLWDFNQILAITGLVQSTVEIVSPVFWVGAEAVDLPLLRLSCLQSNPGPGTSP